MQGCYFYARKDDAPAGVFRRHDKCNCEIVYENGRTRQNLKGAVNEEGERSKKWEVVDEVNVEPPKRFSSDDQPDGFKPKVGKTVDKPERNGIIKLGAEPVSIFVNSSDQLYENAKKLNLLKIMKILLFMGIKLALHLRIRTEMNLTSMLKNLLRFIKTAVYTKAEKFA